MIPQAEVHCAVDLDCPFQYYCKELLCVHKEMFPLEVYTAITYLIIPFAIALCNIGGLSAGIFKVVLLMDMLNYSATEATPLAYAMITGGALANFILLIPRRHPKMDAPLVDHGLVFILLPCILLGTTVGVIVNKFLNDLIQNILITVVCLYFAYKYFLRFRHRRRVERKLSDDSKKTLFSGGLNESLDPTREREVFEEYQKTYHVKEILLSIVFFIVLEVATALCQGKIVKFENCSLPYYIALGCYVIFISAVLTVIFKLTKKRMQMYQRIGYNYKLNLDRSSVFNKIVAGGLAAGLLQGIIGMGSGHMISLVLLSMFMRPEVTSATSGFMIFFIGSASLVE